MMIISVKNIGTSTSKITVIAGQIQRMGVPVKNTLKIIPSRLGRVIKTVVTGADGRYKVYLPLDRDYLIYAQDESKQFNAVIQDNVVPK